MTIHPIRSSVDALADRSDFEAFHDVAGSRSFADEIEIDIDELFDDLDDSLDRSGSFDRDHLLARRAWHHRCSPDSARSIRLSARPSTPTSSSCSRTSATSTV